MTDEPALIAAVCARPDDDTPRKVYADWCDDQGDAGLAARAAFIRAQVKLAEAGGRGPSPGALLCRKPKTRQIVVDDAVRYTQAVVENVYTGPCGACDWCGLTREAAEAFAAMPIGQKILTGGEGAGGWSCEFFSLNAWSRGFPTAIRACGSTFWRDHHAAILAAAPIRRVELVDVPEVTFGPLDNRAVDTSKRDGKITFVASWLATWGGHTERFGGQVVADGVMLADGLDHVLRMRAQHEQFIASARTPLGYLHLRWPKVEFVLPRLITRQTDLPGEWLPGPGNYEAWAAQPHVRAENERRLREGREGAEAARRLAAAVDRLPRPPAD